MMLTNSQWYQIEKLLPSQAGKQGRPRKNDRLVIEPAFRRLHQHFIVFP